jgi:hypothetical protein
MPAAFPKVRPRRMRRTEALRRLARETRLSPEQLIAPIFCTPGKGVRDPIGSMPGVERWSPDVCAEKAREWVKLGIGGVLLFGIPDSKDATGTSGTDPNGIVPATVKAIKDAAPDLVVVTDVCLCEYTDHGHCGVIEGSEVNNDKTAAAAGEAGAGARPGRRRHRRPLGHDGRARGGDSRRARRGGPHGYADPLLRREVRLGLLRPLPRSRRQHAPRRQPARLPDGPRQRARGVAGDPPGPR